MPVPKIESMLKYPNPSKLPDSFINLFGISEKAKT